MGDCGVGVPVRRRGEVGRKKVSPNLNYEFVPFSACLWWIEKKILWMRKDFIIANATYAVDHWSFTGGVKRKDGSVGWSHVCDHDG